MKSLVIGTQIDQSVPLTVTGDPNRIRQILLNFLSNAAKFTQNGKITLKVDRIITDGQETIRLFVEDNGIGITPIDQPHIFERFYRVDAASDQSSEKGIGLGLAIVKSIAEKHAGQISMESKIGFGSTFQLLLPYRQENSQ